ncbi:hypothetical protein AA103587_2617 [Gluconobacter kanchanaburiensis NBRC 103587]|nr:hypothetical protein AA103587_2617 [Gluconobacter kanchanaburiensis NBRC 103587]
MHSKLFPSVSQASTDATGGQYEGYQYLGAGVLLLLGMTLATRQGRGLLMQAAKEHAGLFLALACLTAIALSNRIYFFHVLLLLTHFHVPGAEQMRSSGRMFWPVAYAMMLGGVYGLCRAWPRAWPAIIVTAMTLQWYDTYTLRDTDRQTEMAFLDPAQAEDRQLLALLRPFNRIEIHPRLECDGANVPAVMPLIYAAALQNSFVNTMYTARAMPLAACTDASEQPHPLTADTIIILPGPSQRTTALRWSTKEHARCGIMEDKTFCVSADSHLPPGLATLPEAPLFPVDNDIVMSSTKSEHQEILQSGWSGLEPWGVWSDTQDPSLYFHLPSDIHTATVILRLHATPGMIQHVGVSINGTDIAQWTVGSEDADYNATFSVPSETHIAHMQLRISNPTRVGHDPRLLGVGLLRLRINRMN